MGGDKKKEIREEIYAANQKEVRFHARVLLISAIICVAVTLLSWVWCLFLADFLTSLGYRLSLPLLITGTTLIVLKFYGINHKNMNNKL